MLQSIRDSLHNHKWLGYLVLGALALVFAAWGAYGIVNLSTGSAQYAAEAGGQKISIEAARNAWQQAQQRMGGEIPAPQQAAYQDRLLESMIREALLTDRAHELGYRVSDQAVKDAIRNEPAFQVEGKYNAEVAKSRLEQVGVSLSAFEADLRDSLLRSQIQSGISSSDFLTPAEVERNRALQNEEREVRYVMLSPDKFVGDAPFDDAAVQAYYKTHEAQYMTTESVHLQYAELRLDQLAAQVTVSDADLRAAYDKNKDHYVIPEKRRARHILIPAGKDDAADRKQAQDVLAQAKAGKDFAQLAKQFSQDPGSADKGGDLGWADRNSFVKPFADALFSMKVGDMVGPIKTPFGYHIIKLDEIQPGKARTFEEARPELEAEMRHNMAGDRFGEIQEQLQSKVEQAGNDLAMLAKEFNLQPGDIPQFLRGAGAAPLGAAPPLQDLLFGDSALPPGRIGGPVVLGEDRLVLVKVLEHRKPEPKPVAEVRDTLIAAIRKERGTEGAMKAAQSARAKLESGVAFDAVAKELNIPAEPARFVGRTDPSIPAQLREAAFNSPKPEPKPVYRAVPLDSGGAAVLAVTALRTGGAQPANDQQVAQVRQDAMRHGMEGAMAYVEELRRTSTVRKNPKAFE